MTIFTIAEIACLCAMGFIPLPVMAASGRITFSGAVTEPTCSIATAESSITNASSRQSQRLTCSKAVNAVASATYALSVIRLSSSVPDRVLHYFDTYVKASRADAMDPMLVTQTYE